MRPDNEFNQDIVTEAITNIQTILISGGDVVEVQQMLKQIELTKAELLAVDAHYKSYIDEYTRNDATITLVETLNEFMESVQADS